MGKLLATLGFCAGMSMSACSTPQPLTLEVPLEYSEPKRQVSAPHEPPLAPGYVHEINLEIIVDTKKNTLSLGYKNLYNDFIEEQSSIVVTGKRGWRTPKGEYTIERIKINPRWYIPKSIQREMNAKEPKKWSSYVSEGRYLPRPDRVNRYYQKGGPTNPLGQLALPLKQRPNILLHGTNQPKYFKRPAHKRNLSHGCVRTQSIHELVEFLLENVEHAPATSDKALARNLKGRKGKYTQRVITLEKPIKVTIR